MDGLVRGVVTKEGESGLIGLIDDDGRRGWQCGRPGRFGCGGPRPIEPNSGPEQVEGPVGLGRASRSGDHDGHRAHARRGAGHGAGDKRQL